MNSRSCWLLVENHTPVLLSCHLGDIMQVLEFVECRKLVGVVVVDVALSLLVIPPNDRHASEGCCKTFVSRIPDGSFLDSELSGGPQR
jgi:hypothetical protein